MQAFDGIERESGEAVDLSIIWLHGLGADANDFLPIVGELELPTDIRFVFPNAPTRPVTINGGAVMRAWYDIIGFGDAAPTDAEGLMQSVATVGELIQREIDRGIPPERIVLAGFSQGGAVVLHAGLRSGFRLGGIIGLSTYLPASGLLNEVDAVQTGIPVMLTHGTHDPVIPIALAERSADFIRNLGVSVDWTSYPMGHEVCFPEIRHLSDWLQRFGSD